jgi:hypothetical protein
LRRLDGSGERFRRCSDGGHDAVGSSVVVRTDGPSLIEVTPAPRRSCDRACRGCRRRR